MYFSKLQAPSPLHVQIQPYSTPLSFTVHSIHIGPKFNKVNKHLAIQAITIRTGQAIIGYNPSHGTKFQNLP